MNVLAHYHASLEALGNRKLTPEEDLYLLIGSFIPDVSEFKLVPEIDTHRNSLEFYKSLAKNYHYLGVGAILHGENPRGLDYFAHFQYIPKRTKDIKKIIKLYKKVFPKKTDLDMVAHIIIEFCFDYLTAEKRPELIKRIGKIKKIRPMKKAIYNFANFFNINKRYTRVIVAIARTDQIDKFISNFQTVKGTAHNFQKFLFFKQYRDKSKRPDWFKRITRSSYGFLKSKFKEKQFEQLFARCIELVRKDYDPFMNNAIKNMKKLVRKYRL